VTYSGYYFQYYKDMIFAEQLSILGSLIAVVAIQRFYRNGKAWVLYALMVLALSIGRGFTVLPILVLWVVFELLRRRRGSPDADACPARSRLTSVSVLVLGLGLVLGSTLYNSVVEARYRNTSLGQTSIMEAFTRRAGLDESFNQKHSEKREWGYFVAQQNNRLRRVLYPVPRRLEAYVPRTAVPVALIVGLLFVAFRFRSRWNTAQRLTAFTLLLYGPLWLALARNLTLWHDYTAMYFYGIPLVLYGAILSAVPRRLSPGLVLAGFTVFFAATVEMDHRKTTMAARSNRVTEELQVIAEAVEPGRVIHYEGGYREFLRGVPFASGFYFSRNPVTDDPAFADYVISRRPECWSSHTARNRMFFLCDAKTERGQVFNLKFSQRKL
jgi:hypothetical protein